MLVTIKKSIEISHSLGSENKTTLENVIVGGSADSYKQDSSPPILGEHFEINEFEEQVFELLSTNTFNKDILTLLKTPIADIVGINISCFQQPDGKVITPIRFNLAMLLTGQTGSAVSMGEVSDFSLMNITTSAITKLVISNVVVPAGLKAILSIVVFSKNKN